MKSIPESPAERGGSWAPYLPSPIATGWGNVCGGVVMGVGDGGG